MATVRFIERPGLEALGTLILKLYPLNSSELSTGVIANGAGGDTCSEVETNVYQATVTQALTGWHKAIIELDGSPISVFYVLMSTADANHWCGPYNGSLQAVTPSATPGQSTGYLTCYDEEGVAEEGVKIRIQQTASAETSGYAFDRAIRTVTSDATGLVTVTGMWRGATYQVRRGTGPWVSCVVEDAPTFALPVVLGSA